MAARRPKSPQGIYRRITVRMWGDAKVRSLSRPQPCGQVLWFHLLTGEQTDIIPGLCKIGEAAFAEQLGWPLEGFREAYREAYALGMTEADWDARVVWVPKAIEHNPPGSLNVVKSWADAWDRIPECELKLKAWSTIRSFLERDNMPDSFLKAFDEACPKPRVMPSGKASDKPNDKASGFQDQDQDQEQEEDPRAPARPRSTPDGQRAGGRKELGPLGAELVRQVEEGLGRGLIPASNGQAAELEALTEAAGGVEPALKFLAATVRSRDSDPKSVAWLVAVLRSRVKSEARP